MEQDESWKRFQNRQGAAILADVARHAEVSLTTASRALNHPREVRASVLERVQAAVKALGYVPHGAARALASHRTHAIGALIPTFDNAIFARAIEALQHRLSESGHTLLLACSEYEFRRGLIQAQSVIEHGVDGLMLIGEAHDPGLFSLLADRRLPYVVTWVYKPKGPHPTIGFDNRQAASRMASYLVDIGHRRIAMIAGIGVYREPGWEGTTNDRAIGRIAGVREALEARGLNLPPDRLVEAPYDVGEARRALRILMSHPEPPTAIVCGNDVLAFGALFEARALGLRVPEDLSVVGFDDLDLARHTEPPITTMRVPSAEMGKRAAEYLLARLAGESPPAATELEVSLILRASSAPPTRLAG